MGMRVVGAGFSSGGGHDGEAQGEVSRGYDDRSGDDSTIAAFPGAAVDDQIDGEAQDSHDD